MIAPAATLGRFKPFTNVGVLAALLAAQALRQRVPGGGELAEREPVEIVGLVEHRPSVTCRAMESGASFTTLDFEAGERFVALRRQLGVESFGLNLMLLEPGQRGRIHRHEHQEEVYVVLEGTLTLELDGGETHTLQPRDVARVAPDLRRRLSNRGDTRVALLALGGAEPHVGRDGVAYTDWDETEGRPPQEVPLPPDL